MEELLELLEDVIPGVDFRNSTTLIDDHILSSFDVLTIVSEVEDEFDTELSPGDLIPENFNSAAALWALIQKRK